MTPVALGIRAGVAAMLVALGVAQEGPAFDGRLLAIDGRTIDGRLVVDEGGVVAIGGTTLPFADVMSFERREATSVTIACPHRVWLRSGGELPATKLAAAPAADGKPAQVVVSLPSGLVVELPFTAVRALRHGGSERPEPALFAADLQKPLPNDDLIYVQKDGKAQRSSVRITGFTPDGVDFTLRGTQYEFGFAGLAAIVFGSNTGFAPDRQPRPRTAVDLSTGERLEGRLLAVGTALRLRLDEGVVVEIQPQQLQRLRVASDRLVWLSDLVPSVEQTPAFDRTWPWSNDRSPAGPALVIGGRRFERGIGMVPRTRLAYALGGRFDRFEAWIGIDDRGGPQAHAIFRVLVDGAVAYESQPKTLGQAAEHVVVDLGKCRLLTIEADFGKNYDLGDFCAFGDARVVQR